MKKSVLITALIFAAGSLLADPKDDVSAAAKKLADSGNFSWKQTVDNGDAGGGGGFTPGPTMGKMDKGITYQSISFGDNTIETVLKGTNGARKAPAFGGGGGGGDQPAPTWQTFAEIAAAQAANGGGGGFGGGGGGGFGGRRGGRGGQNQIALPTDQVSNLLSGVTTLTMSGGAYTGDLTSEAATARATRRGGRGFGGGGGGGGFGGGGGAPPAPTDAKGSVSFWVTDGMLSKYEVKLSFKGTDQDGNPTDNKNTTTVEFSDIGSTKIPVPADILAKISQ